MSELPTTSDNVITIEQTNTENSHHNTQIINYILCSITCIFSNIIYSIKYKNEIIIKSFLLIIFIFFINNLQNFYIKISYYLVMIFTILINILEMLKNINKLKTHKNFIFFIIKLSILISIIIVLIISNNNDNIIDILLFYLNSLYLISILTINNIIKFNECFIYTRSIALITLITAFIKNDYSLIYE